MKKIAIIFGGKSVEHDISIITALQTMNILSRNYNCLPIYISKNGKWFTAKNLQNMRIYSDFEKMAKAKKTVTPLFSEGKFLIGRKKVKIDCCFNCCHGLNGEDGSVAGVLQLCDIAYSSSSLLSSAVTMDKVLTKILLNEFKIKNTKFEFFNRKQLESSVFLDQFKESLKYPVIVKPANLGSSVGISVAKNQSELIKSAQVALNFDDKILIEEFLENSREFNCACFFYNEKYYVSKVSEVNKKEIYTFDEKYITETEDKPQEISLDLCDKIKRLTIETYKRLNCFGIVRVDFLYKNEDIYVNEVNSIPGALACYLFENFEEILDLIIEESEKRLNSQSKIKYSYKSDVLKIFEKAEFFNKLKK